MDCEETHIGLARERGIPINDSKHKGIPRLGASEINYYAYVIFTRTCPMLSLSLSLSLSLIIIKNVKNL